VDTWGRARGKKQYYFGDHKAIAQDEFDFYDKRRSVSAVLELQLKHVQDTIDLPFKLVTLQTIDNEVYAARQDEVIRKRRTDEQLIKAVLKSLQKTGEDCKDGEAVIVPNLTSTSIKPKKTAASKVSLPSCDMLGCKSKIIDAKQKCSVCSIHFCFKHLQHDNHLGKGRKPAQIVSSQTPSANAVVAASSSSSSSSSSTSILCAVYECNNVGSIFCNVCREMFCSELLHPLHDCHKMQTKKPDRQVDLEDTLVQTPNNAMVVEPLITSTIVAAPIAVPDESVTANTANSHVRKKAKISFMTKKDRLVDNFAVYNTQATNRGRSVHTASHCCCMTCIVDESKSEVHSVHMNMKTCYESSQRQHKHLSVTCWGG
jgi:hypothetical protein